MSASAGWKPRAPAGSPAKKPTLSRCLRHRGNIEDTATVALIGHASATERQRKNTWRYIPIYRLYPFVFAGRNVSGMVTCAGGLRLQTFMNTFYASSFVKLTSPGTFRRALGRWFRKHGRELPWRTASDAYSVLVSEFMLQQTTVAAVIPYFARWMERFPDIASLAAADEEAVLKMWEGLGYYSRARNLHRAARAICVAGGGIPHELSDLRELPGVGPYTAAAIVAFAFDGCVPVLDANIVRVIARLFNYRRPVNAAAGKLFLEQAARSLLPLRGGCAHASALMDLGATICRSGKPDCLSCPVRGFCSATEPETIPCKPARPQVIAETEWRAYATKGRAVYLVRSEGPRWKGLWTLPPCAPSESPMVVLSYSITRHRVRLEVARCSRQQAGWTAFPAEALPPMPSPHLRALMRIWEASGMPAISTGEGRREA